MSIEYLKEMLDKKTDEHVAVLPAIHPDSLDTQDNIIKFSEAKPVLEHPEVNAVLKDMNALDLLNKYDVNSYHTMAVWVTEALKVFAEENKDTPQAITFNEDFILRPVTEDLNDFSTEFLIEFTRRRFEETGEEGPSAMDAPPQASSWLDKLAGKFGLNDFSVKDLLYLFLINKFGNKRMADDKKALPVTEAYLPVLAEKAPPGMEGWIKSLKSKFQKEYGDDWEEVLYSLAWKKYNANKKKVSEGYMDEEIPYKEMDARLREAGWEENGGIALWSNPEHPDFWLDGNPGFLYVYPTKPKFGPFNGVSDESMLKAFDSMDKFFEWVNSGEADARARDYKEKATEWGWSGYVDEEDVQEGVEDMYGGATKQEHFPRPEDKKAPKASAKVKSDIAQRIKELDKLIKDYKEKTHFLGEVKPAIFNAKTALEEIQDKLNDGSMDAYKEAQIHFQKLMSPIVNLFPPSLVKFLAHGNDGEED